MSLPPQIEDYGGGRTLDDLIQFVEKMVAGEEAEDFSEEDESLEDYEEEDEIQKDELWFMNLRPLF